MSVSLLFKASGSVIVLLAGAMLGSFMAHGLSRRLSLLLEMRAVIERLSTEVSYRASTLSEALTAVASTCRSDCKDLLMWVSRRLTEGDGLPAQVAWQDGLTTWGKSIGLSDRDVSSLELLGPALGGSGREEQARHLESAAVRLDAHISDARALCQRFETFYRQMGVLLAAAVVLLLV